MVLWILVLFLLFFAGLFLVVWMPVITRPAGWNVYFDGRMRYALVYPSSWIPIDCGNGETAFVGKRYDRCYAPNSAPAEYLDNLYMQTFLPFEKRPLIRDYSVPNSAGGSSSWVTIGWEPDDDMYRILPPLNWFVKRLSSNDMPGAISEQIPFADYKMVPGGSIRVGYIDRPELKEIHTKVVSSLVLY